MTLGHENQGIPLGLEVIGSSLESAFCDYAENFSLEPWSYWKIGGSARAVIWPSSTIGVQKAAAFALERKLPVSIVGRSTNILFSSGRIDSIIINLERYMKKIEIRDNIVYAQAGAYVPDLAFVVARKGLSGLEHIAGIPGTVGGLVTMNGGSLRKSISSNIVSVTSVNRSGELIKRKLEECMFSYRNSIFKKNNEIILDVTLSLNKGEVDEILSSMREILRSRREKFPLHLPNCGSVFISDPQLYEAWGPPGKILEECGLKGARIGEVMVSDVHANFIVNIGHGRSVDVLRLVQLMRKKVYDHTGVWLKTEPLFLDESGLIWNMGDYLFKNPI